MSALILSGRQLGLMKNSVLLAAGASACSLIAGIPLALLLNRSDLPGRTFWRAACLVPLAIPPYLQAVVWAKVFGIINNHLQNLMPAATVKLSIYNIAGGIFVFTVSFFPYVILITSSGLRTADRALEEASLLARNVSDTIRGVTLPLIAPHITSSAILVFVFAIVNFEVSDILRLNVFPVEIFINFSAYYNEKAATILSVPLITVCMLLIWGQMVYMGERSYADVRTTKEDHPIFRLGSLGPFFQIYATGLVVAALAVPLVVLLNGAGAAANYVLAFGKAKGQIYFSVYMAALSSLIMAAFSFAAAYYIERGSGVGKKILDFMLQTPFGVPSIVLGIGLIRVWNRPGLDFVYDTPIILVAGYLAGYSPFIIKIMSTRIKQINREFEEAAAFVKGNRSRIFFRILLPLCLPGLIAGFFAGFVLSISNLGTALLVSPPGKATLPIRIYNYMHYGGEETVFALSIILIAIISLSFLALAPGFRVLRSKGLL